MGNKTSFKKGSIPHNKGKKFKDYLSQETIDKIKQTQFKGELNGKSSYNWKGGIQRPTNDCTHLNVGINKRVRRPKHIYEQHYGKIPKGYIIYHIDGNKDNDDINNLEVITRAELLKRNRLKSK